MIVVAHITYHDVSHFQGAYVPTGPTCAKATEGSTLADPEYAGIRRRTLAGGWPFLSYHWLHGNDVPRQVNFVVNVIGRGQPIMLDVESGGVRPTLANVYEFADAYQKAGSQVTLAYIPRWYWQEWGSPSLAGLSDRGIGLVSSNYTTYSDTGPGWDPYGGVAPIVWQYTDVPLDTNAFRGTQAELANLWQNGTDMAAGTWSETDIDALIWRVEAIANMRDTIAGGNLKGTPVPFTAAIKNIPTTTVPAGPLTDVDVNRIAAAVADLLAARLVS
jgi:hypothetical protein